MAPPWGQDTTFFMNIYVNDVDTPAALEAKGRPLASAEVSKEFVEEVCALRNRLHINALLYAWGPAPSTGWDVGPKGGGERWPIHSCWPAAATSLA